MRYSWIVGENDNYDCYVIIGDNRLTDRLFLIKLERLYFPVSDTPARNMCGSRFVVGSLGIFFFLSLSLFLFSIYRKLTIFQEIFVAFVFFFIFMIRFGFQILQIWDEDWIACDLFVWKKKRERGNCGYRKRIKVKIKLVESFLKFGSCKTFLWFIIGFNTKKIEVFFFNVQRVTNLYNVKHYNFCKLDSKLLNG